MIIMQAYTFIPAKMNKFKSPLSVDEQQFKQSLDDIYQSVFLDEITRIVQAIHAKLMTPGPIFPLDETVFPIPCTILNMMGCRLGNLSSLSWFEAIGHGLSRLGISVSDDNMDDETQVVILSDSALFTREQLSLFIERLNGKYLLLNDLASLQRLPLTFQSQLGLFSIPCSSLSSLANQLIHGMLKAGLIPSISLLHFIQRWVEAESGNLAELWMILRYAILAHHWGEPIARLRRGAPEDLDWVRQDESFMACYRGKKRSTLQQDAQLRLQLKGALAELERAMALTKQLVELLWTAVCHLSFDDTLVSILTMTLESGRISESAWMEKIVHGLSRATSIKAVEQVLGQPLKHFKGAVAMLEEGRVIEGTTVLYKGCLIPADHLQPAMLTDPMASALHTLKLPEHKSKDLAILYRLSVECGRNINIRDWFRSFISSIEGKDADEAERDEVLLSRFSRAMHEMQLMGLIQPSGRKRDLMERLVIADQLQDK